MLMRGSAVRCGETETRKTIGLFIFENFYGALRSPNAAASSLSPVARSAAQKLPTLLNHHFLKPQLPFSVRCRCAAEAERRRRPGARRDGLGKKAAASETVFRLPDGKKCSRFKPSL